MIINLLTEILGLDTKLTDTGEILNGTLNWGWHCHHSPPRHNLLIRYFLGSTYHNHGIFFPTSFDRSEKREDREDGTLLCLNQGRFPTSVFRGRIFLSRQEWSTV